MSELKIFSGRANRALAEQICKEANVPLGEAAIQTFSDGELWVKYVENIRGDDVFIIQPTQPPADDGFPGCGLRDPGRCGKGLHP